jgi:hypothetical protein
MSVGQLIDIGERKDYMNSKKQYNETVENIKEITQSKCECNNKRERVFYLAAQLYLERMTRFNSVANDEVDRSIDEAKVFVDAFDKRGDLDG